jgi:hypothetical protein
MPLISSHDKRLDSGLRVSIVVSPISSTTEFIREHGVTCHDRVGIPIDTAMGILLLYGKKAGGQKGTISVQPLADSTTECKADGHDEQRGASQQVDAKAWSFWRLTCVSRSGREDYTGSLTLHRLRTGHTNGGRVL